jgi:hypothetical protein
MRSRIPSFVVLLLGVGCVNEYHPEYHPVSSYTYVQNISYPMVIVENVRAPAPAAHPKGPVSQVSRVSQAPEAPAPAERAATASPTAPGERPLPYVVTRMRLADAMALKRARYARFDVHPTSNLEASQKSIRPLDEWGGSRFDVRRDPLHPDLALVTFDVWKPRDYRSGTPVVVATSSRGDEGGKTWVAFGELQGVDEEANAARDVVALVADAR